MMKLPAYAGRYGEFMRVAVLVIALSLFVVIGLQSFIALGLATDKDLLTGAAAGLFVALLYVNGAACALGAPRLSQIVFAVAAVLALLIGSTTPYRDMTLWGAVAIILAVMSDFGVRELRRSKNPPARS
jgi:uncharacterized membrane protein YhaH (DUF805 family)